MRRMLGVAVAAALVLAGVAAGLALPASYSRRARGQASQGWHAVSGLWTKAPDPDVRAVTHRRLGTTLLDLDEATIDIGPTHGDSAGSIEPFGRGLIFVEFDGPVGYLSFDGTIRYLEPRVPMNLEGLYRWMDASGQAIFPQRFRALDALVTTEPDGSRRLYVSHHRFARDCVQFVVSSIALTATDAAGPALGPGGWRDVFVARPCVPLPPVAPTYSGHESGGRMLQTGPHTLLVTVGHFGFEGIYMKPAVSMDPAVDLGKILELDTATGTARVVTTGHRNPQGLAIDSAGRIWSAEHGPYGGDELNLIVPGRNYGWPATTFGMNYGLPRADWPGNRRQGWHDSAYELPRLAFLPSPGLSNLVEVTGDEFPLWRGDLLLGSMVGQTLFRLRLADDDHVITSEPIRFGQRIRDIVRLDDGRMALSTDAGLIKILQRRRESGEPGPPPLPTTITGFTAIAEARARDPFGSRKVDDREVGQRLFGTYCSSCHQLDGTPGTGPDLRGVVGRKIGSVAGYTYSDALRQARGTWTESQLYYYIADPQKTFPGTTMPPPTIHNRNIDEVIEFLRQP